jgi:lipoprotein NlpI
LNAEAGGAWPRPAYGLFTGISTPQQVLAAAEKMTGDERLLSLCEAYFNIGQYYLAKQDRIKAKEFFEKTVATGMLSFAEYAHALFELQRLSQTPS